MLETMDITLGGVAKIYRDPEVPHLDDAGAIALAEALLANKAEPSQIRALAAHVLLVTPKPKALPKDAKTPGGPPFEVSDVESRPRRISPKRKTLETMETVRPMFLCDSDDVPCAEMDGLVTDILDTVIEDKEGGQATFIVVIRTSDGYYEGFVRQAKTSPHIKVGDEVTLRVPQGMHVVDRTRNRAGLCSIPRLAEEHPTNRTLDILVP